MVLRLSGWVIGIAQPSFPQQRESTHPQSSFPRRRESTTQGAGDGFPSPPERRAAAGAPTGIVGGAHNSGNPRPHNRHSRDGGNPRQGAGDGFPSPPERRAAAAHPREAATTMGGGRTPQSSFPRRRESTAAGRRWFPSPGGGGAPHNRHSHNSGNPRPHNRHSRDGGNPRQGAGDGFPSPRERRWAAGAPTGGGGGRTHNRHSHNSGNPRPHNRHSRDGGNPRRGPAMGSRLHGNDDGRQAHPRQAAGAPTIDGGGLRNVGKAAASMLN